MLDPVSTQMGDRLCPCKPSYCVISHPGQLSLAIPLRVGALSTSWRVSSCTDDALVKWKSYLWLPAVSMYGWGLNQWKLVPLHRPTWLTKACFTEFPAVEFFHHFTETSVPPMLCSHVRFSTYSRLLLWML